MVYYQDGTLLDMISVMINMIHYYELSDLLEMPKVAERVFGFLKALFARYALIVSFLSNDDFMFIMRLVISGVACESAWRRSLLMSR